MADRSSASIPDFQGDAGVQLLEKDLSDNNVAFARERFTERAQNCQRVSVESPIGAPNDRGLGKVLPEEGGEEWAMVGKFGIKPRLRAIRTSLLTVWRANRDVKGGVRVAKGGGEDVGGPEISSRI